MTGRIAPLRQSGCTNTADRASGNDVRIAATAATDTGSANGGRQRARNPRGPLIRRRQPSATAVLLVASLGAGLAFLDSTIVNIAFPAIQSHFHSSGIGTVSWVLNAYNIAFAAILVAGGRLADLLGRKRIFVYGVVLFTIASVLCAFADTVGQLIAFRVLQGVGAAILVPASLGLVVESLDVAHRARGVGVWGATAAIAAGLGPPIGGALVQALSWRWVFLVNLPLGIVAVLAARRVLIESRAAGRRRVPDLRGAVLLAMALGFMTFGLIKGPDWGWVSAAVIGSLVAAAVAMAGFVISSRKHPTPLIEPAFLRIRSFVVGNTLTLIATAGFYAYLLTHVLFLNYVWGYNLLRAGLAIAPAAFVAAAVAAVLGRVADRHGYRIVILLGALIWAGSLLWYIERVGSKPDFLGAWLPGQILQGIGVGATSPMLGGAALAGLAAGSSYATASAVVSSTRQIGAVIGIALLVVVVGTPARGAAEEALRRGWALAAICFAVVAVAAVFLGRTRQVTSDAVEREPVPHIDVLASRSAPRHAASVEHSSATAAQVDPLRGLPLLAGLGPAALAEVRNCAEHIELQAGSYLFRAGEVSDALYVVRNGRLQVLRDGVVVTELGRGEVVGELGLLIEAPRSASIRAVRDSTLLRLTKAQFDKISDAGVLAALVKALATRLHRVPPPAVPHIPAAEVVIAVIGVDQQAPVSMVATQLCAGLAGRLKVVHPSRVDRDGLERAEQAADKVLLHAKADDADWREFCLRVADRVVLVAAEPAPPSQPLPERAIGADLVLAGAPATSQHRRAWEELITPRSTHTVRAAHATADLRPLAARLAGHSVGLVLAGGAARAFAHLGVLEELEAGGVRIDRIAGTSFGAIIAALCAMGLDAAAVDAYIYEYFIRSSQTDYTLPTKALFRGRRTMTALYDAYGTRLVEELPKQFRCISVDLLARKAVVHRSGVLAEVLACSMSLPGLYPPKRYDGSLHVDGGVLDNLPVTALDRRDGPLIAVNIGAGRAAQPGAATTNGRPVQVPAIGDTLIRTMTIGSAMASTAVLAQADVVITPDTSGIGFVEFHQIDRAREAGRMAARAVMPQISALLRR
ncbi:MFS transporter [Mycobacterium szulgai]|uniref:MFS transporter n=1 Tax=Mycobacterium szulgai TaxID=1787 RepID=UPI000A1F4BE0|nr:MFS transporter [Mycobacterium szulgai]MCV7077369.1 MFS transporter [Mycobacterium szulgai]